MARPINKKYFGNRNVGTTGTSDNAIGGEGIASVNFSDAGSFIGNSNVNPITVPNLPAPTLPNGVQATWTLDFEVNEVSTGSGKTNLAVGDTFGVASIPGMVAKVTDLSGANAVFSVTTTGASRGNALALADIPKDTQGITLDKIAGSGTAATFFVDISFRIKTVTITEKGSGYTGTETVTFTKPGTTGGNVPAGTIVLTTDSGNVGSSTNQENAIVPYAYVDGARKVADIIKQTGARRFLVKTADGTSNCTLITDGNSNAENEMDLTAYDSAGGEYWVKKISSRRCTVVVKGVNGGSQFATNSSVPWTFGSATANETVRINNA